MTRSILAVQTHESHVVIDGVSTPSALIDARRRLALWCSLNESLALKHLQDLAERGSTVDVVDVRVLVFEHDL